MPPRTSRLSVPIVAAVVAAAAALHAGDALAAPPGEVTTELISASSVLTWTPVAGADGYNIYRGLIAWLKPGAGAQCHGTMAMGSFSTPANPPIGQGYFYLVTAESNLNGEGTPGNDSLGNRRPLRGSCDAVVRDHVLDRTGYGWDEWTRDRIAALGVQGYIAEQLNPASIDETTNTELNNRRPPLVPPQTINALQGLDLVNAVYARRQLEQQVTMFWDNHFDTDYNKSLVGFSFYAALFPDIQKQQSTKVHYDAQNKFRDLAFNGTFRDIVEASSLGPAMIIFLDTDTNVKNAPNENFARELLELHTMGVDGGYTQQDVVDLARVFTGWEVCKKDASVAADPLSACIPSNTYGTATEPPGLWVPNFRVNLHDTGQKTLFAGTPYQAIIPSTAGNPSNGINDAELAFDAIVAHPATAKFIAKELLQRFVDENPSQAMIDAVVAAWNNPGNPHGVGDLREVLRSVLAQQEFLNPDSFGNKLKDPFEHVVSALRALRGKTDGTTGVRNYISLMQELFHVNSVPTGYSELGGDWLDTNGLLTRQNFGLDMASRTNTNWGADVIGLLNANGVSTAATPNNAPAIVDYLSGVLFGGALTSAERQAAINYLNTDDNGVTSNYNDTRIRETAGILLGYAQFAEQ